jgi:hypothetical protein
VYLLVAFELHGVLNRSISCACGGQLAHAARGRNSGSARLGLDFSTLAGRDHLSVEVPNCPPESSSGQQAQQAQHCSNSGQYHNQARSLTAGL